MPTNLYSSTVRIEYWSLMLDALIFDRRHINSGNISLPIACKYSIQSEKKNGFYNKKINNLTDLSRIDITRLIALDSYRTRGSRRLWTSF